MFLHPIGDRIQTVLTNQSKLKISQLIMQVTLHEPSIRWRHRQAGGIQLAIEDLISLEWFVTATFPINVPNENDSRPFTIKRLPSTFTIPYEDEQALLRDHHVEFRLFAGNRRFLPHVVPLRKCIPLLTETTLMWEQEATVSR